MKAKVTTAPAQTTRGASSSGVEQVMKVSFAMLGSTAAAAGIWSFASLLGGMVSSGGPVALVIDCVKATFGLV